MNDRISTDGRTFQIRPTRASDEDYAGAVQTMKDYKAALDREEDLEWTRSETDRWREANKTAEAIVADFHGIIYISIELHVFEDIGDAVAGAIYNTEQVFVYPGSAGSTDEDGWERQTVISIRPVDFTNPDVKLLVEDNPNGVRQLTCNGGEPFKEEKRKDIATVRELLGALTALGNKRELSQTLLKNLVRLELAAEGSVDIIGFAEGQLQSMNTAKGREAVVKTAVAQSTLKGAKE